VATVTICSVTGMYTICSCRLKTCQFQYLKIYLSSKYYFSPLILLDKEKYKIVFVLFQLGDVVCLDTAYAAVQDLCTPLENASVQAPSYRLDIFLLSFIHTALTLSSEGSPACAVFRPHYVSLNCINLTRPRFPYYNCLPVTCGNIDLNPMSSISLAIRLKVPFLPLGRSCPLQTILLSDLVGCDGPL